MRHKVQLSWTVIAIKVVILFWIWHFSMSAAAPESMHPHHSDSGSFQVKYLGNIVLGRRYTPIILPWVLAEVKRKGEYRYITLNVQKQFLQATLDDVGSEVIFNHKLNRLSRFTRAKWDPACFAYLTREDIEKSPFTCHVFIAVSHEEVRNLTKLVWRKLKYPSSPSIRSLTAFLVPFAPY